jgi:hypothetical protein
MTEWADTSGTEHGYKDANGKPRISSTELVYDIAMGDIAGKDIMHVIGYNPDVVERRDLR